MIKTTKVKTNLPNPPSILRYGEEAFPVSSDGIVEGLTPDHRRYVIELKRIWKLEEIVVGNTVEDPEGKIEEVRNG